MIHLEVFKYKQTPDINLLSCPFFPLFKMEFCMLIDIFLSFIFQVDVW